MSTYMKLTKFESDDSTISVDLSLLDAELDTSQGLQTQYVRAHGAHYGLDLWQGQPAPLDIASERWRCLVPNDEVDALKADLWRIGRGKLWCEIDNTTDDERWAWARLNEMPGISIAADDLFDAPVVLQFMRLSSWFSDTQSSESATVTSDPDTITFTVGGVAPVDNVVITIKANVVGGWNTPTITNQSTGYSFTVDDSGLNGEIARVDVQSNLLERSTDGGSTWTNDTQNLQYGSSQARLFQLAANQSNQLLIEGCSNADITIEWYDTWL